jgi:hypothetical protein
MNNIYLVEVYQSISYDEPTLVYRRWFESSSGAVAYIVGQSMAHGDFYSRITMVEKGDEK